MPEIKPLSDGDMKFNQNLAVKRGGNDHCMGENGRVVRGSIQEEVIPWGQITKFSEQDILAGVTEDDLDQIVGANYHLAALFGGAPQQAPQQSRYPQQPVQGSADDEGYDQEVTAERAIGAARFVDQAHYAGIKRVGMLVDPTTGEALRFRRLVSANQVEVTDEKTGAVIEVMSNQQFENLIRDTGFEVV